MLKVLTADDPLALHWLKNPKTSTISWCGRSSINADVYFAAHQWQITCDECYRTSVPRTGPWACSDSLVSPGKPADKPIDVDKLKDALESSRDKLSYEASKALDDGQKEIDKLKHIIWCLLALYQCDACAAAGLIKVALERPHHLKRPATYSKNIPKWLLEESNEDANLTITKEGEEIRVVANANAILPAPLPSSSSIAPSPPDKPKRKPKWTWTKEDETKK